MKLITKFGAFVVMGAALASAPARAADSAALGTWSLAAETPMGKMESTMILAEDADGAFSVMIEEAPPPAPAGGGGPEMGAMESTFSDVVVDGANFSFKRALATPQGAFNLTYSGSVDGDALTAQAKSDFGDIPITGTRKED